jgi:uncharacterized protein YbjT (DUF2867 family)
VIAVTGASGGIGGRVAWRLAERGVRQRLVVRDPARAPEIESAEVRRASAYGARSEMTAALAGAETLMFVPAPESEDRVEQHLAAVDAAVEAGVARIVYLSFVGASPEATFTLARDHWATEQRIRSAGVDFTFLRMSLYIDFLPRMVSPTGVIAGPADGGRVGAVTRDDLADAAVAVLTSGGHEGETYDITGPEAFSLDRAAAEMGRASGRPILFRDETLEEAYASRAVYSAPHWEVEGWVTTYAAIAAGELDVVSGEVERLAGHPPAGLADFLAAHPDALDHVRPARVAR